MSYEYEYEYEHEYEYEYEYEYESGVRRTWSGAAQRTWSGAARKIWAHNGSVRPSVPFGKRNDTKREREFGRRTWFGRRFSHLIDAAFCLAASIKWLKNIDLKKKNDFLKNSEKFWPWC